MFMRLDVFLASCQLLYTYTNMCVQPKCVCVCVYVEMERVPVISLMLNTIYGESSVLFKGPRATQHFRPLLLREFWNVTKCWYFKCEFGRG